MFIRIKNRERKTKGAHVTQAQTENGVVKARTDILMRLEAPKGKRIKGTATASFSKLNIDYQNLNTLRCKNEESGAAHNPNRTS